MKLTFYLVCIYFLYDLKEKSNIFCGHNQPFWLKVENAVPAHLITCYCPRNSVGMVWTSALAVPCPEGKEKPQGNGGSKEAQVTEFRESADLGPDLGLELGPELVTTLYHLKPSGLHSYQPRS